MPPEPPEPVRETGRDIEGPGNPMPREDGQRMLQVVAVAVVECEDHEGAGAAGGQPVKQFVERRRLETGRAHPVSDPVEIARRDLEIAERLEDTAPRRAYTVECQDDALAACREPEPAVQPKA